MKLLSKAILLNFTIISLLSITSLGYAQESTTDSKKFQDELDVAYADKESSPLTKKDRRRFKGLPFFPINEKYRVVAKFERAQNVTPFKMSTTTDRKPVYELFGVATFSIDGVEYQLNIYQSHKLREMEEYKNHLFLPFTDLTSGVESYGGGRFIDLEIPEGDEIVIDFNKAYNPYCAYNHVYSCPIPPAENDLKVEIRAGVMYSNDKH